MKVRTDPGGRELWKATVPVLDEGPARTYLARRSVWPPAGIEGVPTLAAKARWLPASAAPATLALPGCAAGVLVFAFGVPGRVDAVGLEGLDADGRSIAPRWQCLVGHFGPGSLFEARAGTCAVVHLCTGVADALALSVSPWCGPGRIVACAGVARMPSAAEAIESASVVLHAGLGAEGESLLSRGVRIEHYGPGESPASTLARWIGERAGILEFEGGLSRAEAERAAWTDLLREKPT